MTKEEFVKKVVELAEAKRLDKLDELYDEIIGSGLNHPEIGTRGGEAVTVRWGTP